MRNRPVSVWIGSVLLLVGLILTLRMGFLLLMALRTRDIPLESHD